MKLSDLNKTSEFFVPDSELVVQLKADLSWFEHLESVNIKDAEAHGAYVMTHMIAGWNLTDDDGKQLPVTEDAIRSLPSKVALAISGEVMKIFGVHTEKKTD